MDKKEAIEQLGKFKDRLLTDVAGAYSQRGSDFGKERFEAWRRQINKFLDENISGARKMLDKKLTQTVFFRRQYESDFDVFMRERGNPSVAFLDSLSLDIANDEYEFSRSSSGNASELGRASEAPESTAGRSDRVFIVHGHNEAMKSKAARFVEKLGLKSIILHEQANQGHTIIEKIEAHTDVGFAIVLYTPDDVGGTSLEAKEGVLHSRARQNVVFEHGYLIAKLSRARVVPLVSGKVELPSDISGVVYVDDANWQVDIAKEMRAAGYSIDFNKLLDS
ncbi:nucleotide-binding protein [Stenotrophomonas sp. GD03993]|uniref:TIR domain-containing protein n=1 Tax=unclassified Stenotrophomonas TaxID=196198 RepID=UPI0013131E1B|nr:MULTISPECIES: nucleotide-binding protein [unclassified Stenotrophomonas]MBH1460859.1 nucleotide-binding protein [Stenotrophomonas maltophilia]MDH0189767.1 nucleotide-binding protein [Stenotrophomonas sp. GD04051]MDH0466477.1 nucleotide-binding protein [Stenotrophomonas sp. GD03993]MDH0878530.1 nucleotide-binding protein [Stenotrophomonas sp. GD03877]MDH2157850.1 nucleotide-binding protein [Stenotrophomonas sp. GD03657]